MRGALGGRQGGFTLLETLVVVIVLGLLMVGLTQGVRTALALWNAQQRRVGETAELDAGARILRTLLSDIAIPSAAGGGGAEAAVAVKGDAGRLSFVGDLPTGLGNTRRADIVITLHEHALVLSWMPHRHETPLGPPSKPTDTELVGGVDRLEFAYWGPAAPGEAAAWLAQWDAPAPPQLIRVRLVFAKGDRRRWPDLIAAPTM